MVFALQCIYWFFVSFRKKFSDNTRVRIFFFCRAKREFFFQYSTLRFMTKTLNQIIFLFLHQNQNIFFSNIGNQNKMYHTFRKFRKFNRKIVERIKIDTPITQIYDLSLSWLGTGTSIKSGGIKLVLWTQTSNVSEMMWSYKSFYSH